MPRSQVCGLLVRWAKVFSPDRILELYVDDALLHGSS
jgi:hypothetical protein